MIVLRMAGKILLLPVWLLLATAHLLVKIVVEIYCIGKGIVNLILGFMLIGTLLWYRQWERFALLQLPVVSCCSFCGSECLWKLYWNQHNTKLENGLLSEETIMEKEYIQLPALKRDLDPDVVKVLWAFIQLPEEYQARYQEQYELLNQRKEEADRQLQENIEKIDADAIHLYEETMRSMIRDIVQQSCNLACWVRYHKYDLEESLEEMIDQQPHAAKYIIAMNILMDDAEGSESPFEGNSFMTS